jgi:hypothetical protein
MVPLVTVRRRHLILMLFALATIFVLFWCFKFWLVPMNGAVTRAAGKKPEGITVVIQTFRRNECLERAVRHWRSCKIVKEIAVSWGDSKNKPSPFLKGCSVFFTEDRLSARFSPQVFATDALFIVDDDVVYPCNDLKRVYDVWLNRQDDMVGFVVRHVPKCQGYQWNRHYFDKKYNLMLATKGALLHSSYYRLISSNSDPDIVAARNFTDSLVNSDDLLVAFVFARARHGEGLVPVQPSRIFDLECGEGISSSNVHIAKREKTFARLSEIFGSCPFISYNFTWT